MQICAYVVSILVLVDVALERFEMSPAIQQFVFQSLFSWMSLWNYERMMPTTRVPQGFNPCSRGCRSGTILPGPTSGEPTCFNPCSRGCRSGTAGEVPLPGRLQKVSILVLVDVALERKSSPAGWVAPLVSILVLVDVALERGAARGRDAGILGFQSLFSWMSLWNAFLTVW